MTVARRLSNRLLIVIFINSESIKKRQTTFWKCQDKGYDVIILKFGLRINAVYYFKDQRRPLNRLAVTVMFRGTPCITSNTH